MWSALPTRLSAEHRRGRAAGCYPRGVRRTTRPEPLTRHPGSLSPWLRPRKPFPDEGLLPHFPRHSPDSIWTFFWGGDASATIVQTVSGQSLPAARLAAVSARPRRIWHVPTVARQVAQTGSSCFVADSPQTDTLIASSALWPALPSLTMPRLDLLAVRAVVVVVVHGPVRGWVLWGISVVRRNLCHVVVLQEERCGRSYTVRPEKPPWRESGRLSVAHATLELRDHRWPGSCATASAPRV